MGHPQYSRPSTSPVRTRSGKRLARTTVYGEDDLPKLYKQSPLSQYSSKTMAVTTRSSRPGDSVVLVSSSSSSSLPSFSSAQKQGSFDGVMGLVLSILLFVFLTVGALAAPSSLSASSPSPPSPPPAPSLFASVTSIVSSFSMPSILKWIYYHGF